MTKKVNPATKVAAKKNVTKKVNSATKVATKKNMTKLVNFETREVISIKAKNQTEKDWLLGVLSTNKLLQINKTQANSFVNKHFGDDGYTHYFGTFKEAADFLVKTIDTGNPGKTQVAAKWLVSLSAKYNADVLPVETEKNIIYMLDLRDKLCSRINLFYLRNKGFRVNHTGYLIVEDK
jgi:hypothetical protein